MQKLAPSQFNALLEEQRDASQFDDLTEQTAFLLAERFDRAILLSYCGYAMTYESLLSLAQKLAAVHLFLAQNHEMTVQLRQTLTPFAERALLGSVDALASGTQINTQKLQDAIQYVNINKASLKNLAQLSRHVRYLVATAAYSEQLRVAFCGLFSFCELKDAILLAMSRRQCRVVENLQKTPEIFRVLANAVFQTPGKAVFVRQLQSFQFLLTKAGGGEKPQNSQNSKNAQIHIIFMQAFAMATTSQSPCARRNAATILQFFPLQYNNANATLAELNFLQCALDDDAVDVRAEAAQQSAGVVLACGGAEVQFSVLARLASDCFDAALAVRRAALGSVVRLVESRHEGCVGIVCGNMEGFKSLLKDVAVISALSARLYALLMAAGKIPPDPQIFQILDNAKFDRKITLAVLFPGGESGFVQAPKACFEQLFLGCQRCPGVVCGVLQQYIQAFAGNYATKGQITVLGSICAVCAAVFIEIQLPALLDVVFSIQQELARLSHYYTEYQPSRGVEEALKAAIAHVQQAVENQAFQEQLQAHCMREKSLQGLLAWLGLRTGEGSGITAAQEAERCVFRLDDLAIRAAARCCAAETFTAALSGEKSRYYMGIMHKICASAASSKEQETGAEKQSNTANQSPQSRPLYTAFDVQPAPARVAEALAKVLDYQQAQMGVWDMIALLIEFIYQNSHDQAANRCFLLLKCVNFGADEHRGDAPVLLTLAADIYLNIRHFSLSAEAAEALCAFVDAVLGCDFEDQACALVAGRLKKEVLVRAEAFPEDEREVVKDILSQRAAV